MSRQLVAILAYLTEPVKALLATRLCPLLGGQYSGLVEAVKEKESIVAWSVIDKAYALCLYKEGAKGVPNIRIDKHLTRPNGRTYTVCVSR